VIALWAVEHHAEELMLSRPVSSPAVGDAAIISLSVAALIVRFDEKPWP